MLLTYLLHWWRRITFNFTTTLIGRRLCREDLELIERELCQLTQQYSVKCLENAALLERLDAQTRTIHASRLHIHNLLSRSAVIRQFTVLYCILRRCIIILYFVILL